MDKYDKQVWIKHRELEIAVWEQTLAKDKLDDDTKKLYENAIEKNKERLENEKKR